MDSIAKQKALADRVYALLKDKEGLNILLAGGAPRDWHIGKQASDFDFYIQTNNWLKTATTVADALEIDLHQKGSDKYEDVFRREPSLLAVLEGEMYEQKVQFMFITSEPKEFVEERFDLSICKMWYANQEIGMNWEANLSLREGFIIAPMHYSPHLGKLMARDEWKGKKLVHSWDSALKWIERKEERLDGGEPEIDFMDIGGVHRFEMEILDE